MSPELRAPPQCNVGRYVAPHESRAGWTPFQTHKGSDLFGPSPFLKVGKTSVGKAPSDRTSIFVPLILLSLGMPLSFSFTAIPGLSSLATSLCFLLRTNVSAFYLGSLGRGRY